jgi:hypothetical protein
MQGRQASPVKQCDELNIDSEKFALDIYVDGLLRNKSLEHLLQYGNVTVAEIKSLDSDMQMLVYENYNKFISATDTVKRMKNRVEVNSTATHLVAHCSPRTVQKYLTQHISSQV